MKIAVIGAGLSGLAFSWHYKKLNPSHSVVLFDPIPICERTSSLANLLYPFVGMRSKLNWKGFESLESTEKLLKSVSEFSEEEFYRKIPLLKLAYTKEQREAFYLASTNYTQLQWKEKTSYGDNPGLWMESMIQVDGNIYLAALTKGCQSIGIEYKEEFFNEDQKKDFDLIIVATGYQASKYFKNPSLTCLKGQALILEYPKINFELPYCLIADGLHLIPSIDKKTLYVGNTFERKFQNVEPCLKKAKELLWTKLTSLFTNINEKTIIEVKAGIRLTAPSRLPLIGQIDSKTWIFTALGSKGLLYHSYLGEILANAITQNSLKLIPSQFLINKS